MRHCYCAIERGYLRPARISLLFLLLCIGICISEQTDCCARDGLFPSDPSSLWEQVGGFINLLPARPIGGKIVAMLLPGENYLVAGSVMGIGYQSVQDQSFDRILIVVQDKSLRAGMWIPRAKRFVTPLGAVPAEENLAAELSKQMHQLHIADACPPDEFWYQLGFLQRLFGNHAVLALMLGEMDLADIESVASQVASLLEGQRVLVIAVSNLASGDDFIKLSRCDRRTINSLVNMDYRKLWSDANSASVELSALESAVFTMAIAKRLGAKSGKLLKHIAKSGLPVRKHTGIAAVAWYGESENDAPARQPVSISPSQGYQLWELAASIVVSGQNPKISANLPEASSGIFISISRGDSVIAQAGDLFTTLPLAEAVRVYAMLLTSPNRMGSLRGTSLCGAKLSVCIAEPAEGVSMPTSEMGVCVRLGKKVGVLLPGEASDLQPKRRMELACMRAGVSSKSWCVPETDVHFFTVQVFSGALPSDRKSMNGN